MNQRLEQNTAFNLGEADTICVVLSGAPPELTMRRFHALGSKTSYRKPPEVSGQFHVLHPILLLERCTTALAT